MIGVTGNSTQCIFLLAGHGGCVFFVFFRWFVGWELCFMVYSFNCGGVFLESPKNWPKTFGSLVGLNHTNCETYIYTQKAQIPKKGK